MKTVEMIDLLKRCELSTEEIVEILDICEYLALGLIELYCQKKMVGQQLAAFAWKFDFFENFLYNIYRDKERKPYFYNRRPFCEAALAFSRLPPKIFF